MTDSLDFRRVKETEALAKRLGFKLSYRSGSIILISAKDWPAAIFGKDVEVITPTTVEEVRSWLRGWANYSLVVEDIGLDIAEYKKRREDQKILNALKGKK